jgi:translation initiation factor IF-2
MRENVSIGEGKLSNLQVLKSPVNEVVQNQECGMKYEGDPVVLVNDSVTVFMREIRKRFIGG